MADVNTNVNPYAEEDAKRLKRIKFLYPFYQFAASLSKAFSTYVTYFYTNVYMFSVNFTATITLTSSVISWVGTPAFAAFIDGFKFKKAKYWPWIVVGSFLTNGIMILIMALPAITGKNVELMALVFALRIIFTLAGPMSTTPMSGAFPRITSDPATRAYLAASQKIGRDGGKTVFGYVVPVLLAFFSGTTGTENTDFTMTGFAIVGAICYGAAIAGFWLYAFLGLKDSYIEREAIAADEQRKKAKVPLSAMFKCIFTNRPILGLFLWFGLHKAYYFIYTSYATYVFRYYFQNVGAMGGFMTVFNLTAIIGVAFGPYWTKLWKDSKRACTAAYAVHVALTAVIFLTFSPDKYSLFAILFGASSFFMGMLETWVLPGYANAAEYGAWKSGARLDSLVMAIYNLSLTACHLVTTLVATAALNSFDYTNWLKAYNNKEVGITDEVLTGLKNLFTLWPLILSVGALLAYIFLFNLNDKKMEMVHEDLKNGKTQATSEYKL